MYSPLSSSLDLVGALVQHLCDVVSPQHSHSVKRAKDIGAGGVIILATLAVCIGLLIFLPHFL